MFKKNKKRLYLVRINFIHGSADKPLPPMTIELTPGQSYVRDIVQDEIWEGDTLVRSYDWLAGYTRVYRFFYQ